MKLVVAKQKYGVIVKGEDHDHGNMIGCDNKQCHIQWFHLSCLKLTRTQVPKGNGTVLIVERKNIKANL